MINKIAIVAVGLIYCVLLVYLLTHDTPKIWSGFTLILPLIPIMLRNREEPVQK